MPTAHRAHRPIGSSAPRAPLEHRELATPSALEQLERAVVVGADVLGDVRVARERDRRAGLAAHIARNAGAG